MPADTRTIEATVVVEAAFVHTLYGIPRGATKPRSIGVVDTFPIALRRFDAAPVAVVVTPFRNPFNGREDQTNRHAYLLATEKISVPERGLPMPVVTYRAAAGWLWRPVHFGGYPLAVGALSELNGFWESQMQKTPGDGIYRRLGVGPLAAYPAWNAVEAGTRYAEIATPRSAIRQWIQDDRAACLERARHLAQQDFSVIDGIIHIRTPGPTWKIVEKNRVHLILDATELDAYRADRLDLAVELAKGDDRTASPLVQGDLEILDANAYAACASCEEAVAVHIAAKLLSDSSNLPIHERALLQMCGDLRTFVEAAWIPWAGMPGLAEAEATVREMLDAMPCMHPDAVSGHMLPYRHPARNVVDHLDSLRRDLPAVVARLDATAPAIR